MPSKKQSALRNRASGKATQRAKLAKARAAREEKQELQADVPSTPTQAAPTSAISTDPISASKRKLGYITPGEVVEGEFSDMPDTFTHLSTLQSLFDGVICRECNKGPVKVCHDSTRTKGLAVGLVSMCEECGAICGRTHTSRKSTGQSFEVNRAVVAATLNIGIGHGGLTRFCEVLGMPSLHSKTYHQYVNLVHQHAIQTSSAITDKARSIVKDLYEPDDAGVIDIAVTFDGTWHKRGHTSNHGAAVVICSVTGLVLDSHVMSLYCQICRTQGDMLADPQQYAIWWEQHKDSCHKNHSGSSGGMEAQAAKVLWGRSLEYGIRYTTLIGDGDSKTFNAITEMDPYNGKMVKKAECVNHVAKRLGTALRNLVASEKKRGTTLGSRGTGTLTQEKIGKLQGYYTKAVRTYNSSVEEMNKGIWAGFYHSTSSDERSQHHFCPEGHDSWCFFNRTLSHGKPAPSHVGRLTTALNPTVAAYIEPVYKRLTDPALLDKCLLGVTQNQNESFHSQIWLRCPKHIFVNRPRIEVATSLAICEWNQGSLGTQQFISSLGLLVSELSIQSGRKRDKTRIRKAEDAIQQTAKQRRQQRKSAAQRETQRRQQDEAHPYEPGIGGYS